MDGVVARNCETSQVGEKLPTKVEYDEEEIEGHEADGTIGFGNVGRFLEVVQDWVFRKLNRHHHSLALHTEPGHFEIMHRES